MVGERGRRRVAGRMGVAAAVLIASGLALGGCSRDERRPAPAPPAQTLSPMTPSPSPVPTPSAGQAAEADTAAGAEAFARYVMQLYAYTYLTGNTGPWRDLSAPKCGFCADTLDEVVGIKNRQQHSTGGAIAVRSAVAAPSPPPGSAIVSVVFDEEPSRVLDSDGVVVDSYDAQKGQAATIVLKRQGDRWSLYEITGVE